MGCEHWHRKDLAQLAKCRQAAKSGNGNRLRAIETVLVEKRLPVGTKRPEFDGNRVLLGDAGPDPIVPKCSMSGDDRKDRKPAATVWLAIDEDAGAIGAAAKLSLDDRAAERRFVGSVSAWKLHDTPFGDLWARVF